MIIRSRLLILSIVFVGLLITTASHAQNRITRFAVIGDFGLAGKPEQDVAELVKSWKPDFIITMGDNNYSRGEAITIDSNIGQYYHDFIGAYSGKYGKGAAANNFYPTLGNHDWITRSANPYLAFFTLPGNERYYDFVRGAVHFFVIDSDSHEPDGISSTSKQANWLKNALASSTAPWKIVYFHHPPYSSGTTHGSSRAMQWPFAVWGASLVLSGHEHNYERLMIDGFPYIVNGLGGSPSRYPFGKAISGSVIRYNEDWGAQLVEATDDWITFKFITRSGDVIDTFTLGIPPTATPAPTESPNG